MRGPTAGPAAGSGAGRFAGRVVALAVLLALAGALRLHHLAGAQRAADERIAALEARAGAASESLEGWVVDVSTEPARVRSEGRQPCRFEILSSKAQMPQLLFSLSVLAEQAGLDLLTFEPLPEVDRGVYAEVPVRIVLTGEFTGVAAFAGRIDKLHRILNLDDLGMVDAGPGRVRATADVVAYRWTGPET